MTRQEASRLNGAKSKGPITEQGKARSSQNATKYGLASPMLVLRHESDENYHELCEEYRLEFDPKTPAEYDLVYEMAASTWRTRRLHTTETMLIQAEIELQRPAVDLQFNNPSDDLRMALAFKSLADNSKAYSLLMRYESQILRSKDRAMQQFKKLRDERKGTYPVPEPDSPNEPNAVGQASWPVEPREAQPPNEPKAAQPQPDAVTPNEPKVAARNHQKEGTQPNLCIPADSRTEVTPIDQPRK